LGHLGEGGYGNVGVAGEGEFFQRGVYFEPGFGGGEAGPEVKDSLALFGGVCGGNYEFRAEAVVVDIEDGVVEVELEGICVVRETIMLSCLGLEKNILLA
jgi:hypothetical protein